MDCTDLEFTKITRNAQEQEVNDLSEILRVEHNKYVQYKIIYDTLEEFINSHDDEHVNLKRRIKDIMISESLVQCMSLDEHCDKPSENIFGIEDMGNTSLNFSESKELQILLKQLIDQKYKKMKADFNNVTEADISSLTQPSSSSSIDLNDEDKLLLEYRNKLMAEQKEYIKNLLNLTDLLEEIKKLRLEKLPEITELKIKECQVEEKINSLKCHGFHGKSRVDIFTETSCSLNAYKELIKDIKDQQQDCKREIEELTDLKQKYKDVSCKQYDDILKSYLRYKSAIEKKKLVYDCLKS